jgi:hypothetical protein
MTIFKESQSELGVDGDDAVTINSDLCRAIEIAELEMNCTQ